MQSYRVVAVGDRVADAVPKTLRHTLNAYARGRRLVSQKYVSNGEIEPQLQQLLQNRDVAYIHARDTDAGCYDFCIERTSDEADPTKNTMSNGESSHE